MMLLLSLGLLTVTTASPPAPPAPCRTAEARQLDFWVGEWDVSWPASPSSPAGTGTNRIEKILDGCVISENFEAHGPGALVGKSYSIYDERSKQWRQTWVDNQGSYMDFLGDFSHKEKIFWRETADAHGKPVRARMVFLNVSPDSFDWRWEKSGDGGKTWQVQWPIHYSRKKP